MIHNGRPNQPATYQGRPVVIKRKCRDHWRQRTEYTVRCPATGERWTAQPRELKRAEEVER